MADIKPRLAVIGGTGLYGYEEIDVVNKKNISTPYGEISDAIVLGLLHGYPVAFLPRHGQTHRLPPHLINYRANLWALKKMGIKTVLSVNAVGGIHQSASPESIVIPDQVIDYTYGREHTYCSDVNFAMKHVDFTCPFDKKIHSILEKYLQKLKMAHKVGGVYACTQGPRLETAAEIRRLEKDGCCIVGMTVMPEAALARELELNYASICVVVNWAAGKTKASIDMEEINYLLLRAMGRVKTLIGACLTELLVNE